GVRKPRSLIRLDPILNLSTLPREWQSDSLAVLEANLSAGLSFAFQRAFECAALGVSPRADGLGGERDRDRQKDEGEELHSHSLTDTSLICDYRSRRHIQRGANGYPSLPTALRL